MSQPQASAIEGMTWLAPAHQALAALRARGGHALLLHGPSGTGKWDLAMAYAADVLCENPTGAGRACGACTSCRLGAAGNHPDLRVVVPDALAARRPAGGSEPDEGNGAPAEPAAGKAKPSREIKIDQVRELLPLFTVSAHRGGARVVVLGPAESLNLPAANALLKVLEEPPPDGLFLLVADQIDRCLPTILSRCAPVRVVLPRLDAALDWLQTQGLDRAAGAARLIEAGGAPLAALHGAADVLDAPTRALLLGLLRRGRSLGAADVVGEVPRTVPIGPAVDLFQRWAWDYFSYRAGGGLRYHPEEGAAFAALVEDWHPLAAGAWASRLQQLRAVAEHPLNPRAAIEGMLLDYVAALQGSGASGDPPRMAQ